MKKSIAILALAVLSFALVQNAMAQTSATANQSVTLGVNAVYRIATSGSPTLTISNGNAGDNALTTVSDNSSTYSVTLNSSSGSSKITAGLNSALAAGYKLQIALVSALGTGATADISDGSAKDVVTTMGNGADKNKTITYTFDANASAGVLSSTTKTVTLTVTN